MARKLQPDYIKWVLELNTDQVREEYHKLEKENKELEARNRSMRKEMARLSAVGKKNSAEWKNLDKAIRDNSKTISLNRAKMDELFKRKIDRQIITPNEQQRRASTNGINLIFLQLLHIISEVCGRYRHFPKLASGEWLSD